MFHPVNEIIMGSESYIITQSSYQPSLQTIPRMINHLCHNNKSYLGVSDEPRTPTNHCHSAVGSINSCLLPNTIIIIIVLNCGWRLLYLRLLLLTGINNQISQG